MRNQLLALTVLLVAATPAYAAVSFDFPSPQPYTQYTTPTCDTGDDIEIYTPDGNIFANGSCSALGAMFPGTGVYGVYHFVECLSTNEGANCGQAAYTSALSDPGFVSDNPFNWVGPEEATTTATTSPPLGGMDERFIWGVALFFLSYPVWGRIFSL